MWELFPLTYIGPKFSQRIRVKQTREREKRMKYHLMRVNETSTEDFQIIWEKIEG